MWFKRNKVLVGALLLAIVVLPVSISVFGCVPTGAVPRGWSGGVVTGDTLLLGSMEGSLVALNTSSGARLWPADFTLKASAPSGGFGCAQGGQRAVAIYGTPAVANDMVYVGGYNGKIYALSISSGDLKWVYPREDSLPPIVGGPVLSQDSVYFGSADGKVYALDAVDLHEKWRFETGGKIWSTPAISGDTIYIGSFDSKLYALNAADGSQRWAFSTEGAIVSTPVVYDSTIYVGSFDRHLYAINTDGSLKWKSDFVGGKWFWAGTMADNGMLYAPSLDGKVYVVNAQTGEKVAELDLKTPISSSPVVVGKLVIVATESGTIYAIQTDNNQASIITTLTTDKGEAEEIYAPLSASGEVVFIHTQTPQHEAVYALNPQTGRTLWTIVLSSQ